MNRYEVSIGVKQPPLVADNSPVANTPAVIDDADAPIDADEVVLDEIATGGFWEDLHARLNPLVPSFSDGAEHKTVVMLRQAMTEPAKTQAEQNFRQYVIALLIKISKDFSEYASQLSNAEVVQVERPTSSGEMAYQIDHSAPTLEALA
jgi:hypothetical protein